MRARVSMILSVCKLLQVDIDIMYEPTICTESAEFWTARMARHTLFGQRFTYSSLPKFQHVENLSS